MYYTITALLIGLGLAATAGFRVFVPLLIGSLAVRAGMVQPSEEFLWIASDMALILFSVATIIEIAAYYVPWIDNLLDTIATPAAVVAGVLLSGTFIGESTGLFRWTVAIIAGGGIAALVQGITVVLRGGSSATTGGLGNPILSTFELIASLVMGVLSLFAPILVIVAVVFLAIFFIKKIVQKRRRLQVIQ